MCINPLTGLFVRGNDGNKGGCETEGARDSETEDGRRGREREPLFTLFGNNHRVKLVPTVNARWCPSPACHVFETARREEDQEWHVEQRSPA